MNKFNPPNFNGKVASGDCIRSAKVNNDTYRELAAHHTKSTHADFSKLHAISCFHFFQLFLLTFFHKLISKLSPRHYRDTFFDYQPPPNALFCLVTPCATAIDYGTNQSLYQSKYPTHPHRAFSHPLQRVTRAVCQRCFSCQSILATGNKHDP